MTYKEALENYKGATDLTQADINTLASKGITDSRVNNLRSQLLTQQTGQNYANLKNSYISENPNGTFSPEFLEYAKLAGDKDIVNTQINKGVLTQNSAIAEEAANKAGVVAGTLQEISPGMYIPKGVAGDPARANLPNIGTQNTANAANITSSNGMAPLALTQSIEDQKNEAAVKAGTMIKVPIGSGFGYVPVGSAGAANIPNIGTNNTASPTTPQGGTTTTTPPAVGTSAQARNETREQAISRQRAELEKGLEKPTVFKSAEEFKKLREEKGVAADEEELTSIQNEARLAKEELNQFKQTSGKELSMGGYTGGISEAERNLNFRLSSLALREQAVISRLNNKNTYINTVIGLGKDDYQTALTNYNNEYTKNVKAVELYNAELDDQQKDALTGFTTLTNLFKEGNLSELTPQITTQLNTYENQLGLPQGSLSDLFKGIGEQNTIQNIKTDSDGNVYTTVMDKTTHLPTGIKILGKLPQTPTSTELKEEASKYAIKSGDTFNALAEKFGTTVQALRSANVNADENNLKIGQKINIPNYSNTVASPQIGEQDLQTLLTKYGIKSTTDLTADKLSSIPLEDLLKIQSAIK